MRITASVRVVITLSLLLLFSPVLAAQRGAMEPGIDRPGSDYKDFELDRAEPKLCMAACTREADCKAWTYVKPGVQGDKARCWLKNEVPDKDPKEYCVSGLKTSSGGSPVTTGMEQNTDRTGGDYDSFDLKRADPGLCRARCMKEAECKAWTYVKPGVQGDNARCWLKNIVPDPGENDCCVSGVKK